MKKELLVILIIVAGEISVFAESGGGGGILFGYHAWSYPFFENFDGWNNNKRLTYIGGYGYGIHNGYIGGGFGYKLYDSSGDSEFVGYFGGFIIGKQLLTKPFNISIVSWTGFGPMSTSWEGDFEIDGDTGFICVLEEIDLEVGLPISRWFMPTLYVGIQVSGNIIPWDGFNTFVSYTPVFGFRIQWGALQRKDGASTSKDNV